MITEDVALEQAYDPTQLPDEMAAPPENWQLPTPRHELSPTFHEYFLLLSSVNWKR
jgi:hypothetical protein